MSYKVYTLVVAIFCATLNAGAVKVDDRKLNEALERLDRELDRRDVYIAKRQTRIDSIRSVLASERDPHSALALSMKLADEFTSFNTDSALVYYNKGVSGAQAAGLDSLRTAFVLKCATYLPLTAFITDAVQSYEEVDTVGMSRDMLELYFDSGRQMYSYIASFFTPYDEAYRGWIAKSIESQRLLLGVLDKDSAKFKLNQGEYYYMTHDYAMAEAALEELMRTLPETDNLYARAAHMLADLANVRGDTRERIYFLTLSAIGDLLSATLEVTSLQDLGKLMFDRDNPDVARAYRYLSTALGNAVECHASMRMIQSSEALPIIEKAHRAEVETWRSRMHAVIVGMAVMLLLLIVMLIVLRREMRHMRRLQESLKKANDIKEVYISQFLNLCSIYMDKLNQLCKTVNRKISANNIDDLYKITKSGKFVEEESKEFYAVFDNAFLHIYPTFVESVNALLRPDEQIVLKDGELLNTDLRILAFMRLGIEESNRIAQILNYSVYTIYTYRNKLKNRAINRDSFENDIMNISSIG